MRVDRYKCAGEKRSTSHRVVLCFTFLDGHACLLHESSLIDGNRVVVVVRLVERRAVSCIFLVDSCLVIRLSDYKVEKRVRSVGYFYCFYLAEKSGVNLSYVHLSSAFRFSSYFSYRFLNIFFSPHIAACFFFQYFYRVSYFISFLYLVLEREKRAKYIFLCLFLLLFSRRPSRLATFQASAIDWTCE